ncbi:MAG: erythromycin esterase family protein [Bacteroidetes bacterium]|nr:erythromycin esterase family protein [Bacteroidota bacterium]
MRKIFLFIFICNACSVFGQWDWGGPPIRNIDVRNNKNFTGFEVLDSAMSANRVLLSGVPEESGNFNIRFAWKLFSYLNEKHGVQHILLETGPARAELINAYISGKDSSVETLLKSVSNLRMMRFYRNLKRLNLNKPEGSKIKVHGMDVEKNPSLPVVSIAGLLPDEGIPDRLRVGVESLKGAARYVVKKGLEEFESERKGNSQDDNSLYYQSSSFSVRETGMEFLTFYDSLRSEFQRWLGSDFGRLDEAVSGLRQAGEWRKLYSSSLQATWRAEEMFRNLNKILTQFSGQKFYGNISRCEIFKGRLSEGCGYYDYAGLLYKMLNMPESKEKKILNLAVVSGNEVDKFSTPEGLKPFIDQLNALIARTLMDSTRLFSPADSSWGTAHGLLFSGFDYVLIHRGISPPDPAEMFDSFAVDDATDWITAPRQLASDQGKAYVDLFNLQILNAGYGKLNTALTNQGLSRWKSPMWDGFSVLVADPNTKVWHKMGLQWAFGQGSGYSAWSAAYEPGFSIWSGTRLKWLAQTHMGYSRLRLVAPSDNTLTPFVTQFKPPRIIYNPAFTLGLGSSLLLDLGKVFFYGSAGYRQDLGEGRWRAGGGFTGDAGQMYQTGFQYGAGFGFCVPLNTENSREDWR